MPWLHHRERVKNGGTNESILLEYFNLLFGEHTRYRLGFRLRAACDIGLDSRVAPMDLFVPTNDVAAYFGARSIIVLPVEDADSIDPAEVGQPVLLYVRLSHKRAHLATDLSDKSAYRVRTPPPVRPIIAFTSDAGKRAVRSLSRWFKIADPERDYAPLDLRELDEPVHRRLSLLEEIRTRGAAENLRLARTLSETRGELAKLRQDVEALQDDLFECTQQLAPTSYRVRTVFPVGRRMDDTLTPGVGPFGSVYQALPCKARGLAGVDLYFVAPAAGVEGTLFFDLVGREDGSVLRSWELDYIAADGWVHLPCKEVLKSFHVYLDLTIRWSNTDPGAPALTLADASEMREAFCRLDDAPVPNRALALRIWSGPPGQFTKAKSGRNWASPKTPEECLYLSLPSHRIAAAQPLSDKDKQIQSVKHIGGGELQVKPQASHISAARIRKVVLTNVEEIRADIRLAHDQSPHVEFALAAVVQGHQLDSTVLAAKRLPKEVLAFSGWHIQAPNMGPGLIELPLKDLGTSNVDLILGTRTHNNVSGANAWARWSGLRLLWRPNTAQAKPLGGSTGQQQDKSLEILHRRREHFAAIVRGSSEPLATLVCCLHRRTDIKNMAVQLSQQLYLNKEIIIVINNESISEHQVAAALVTPEDVRVLRCNSESSLGECLNRAVQNSNGEFILKFDADDLYFPNYARDMVAAAVEQCAKVVGKRTIFVYSEEDNRLYLKHPYASNQHAFQTAGGTLCIDQQVFKQVMFRTDLLAGTDLGFHTDCEQHGIAVFSADPFNYVYVRHRDNSRHTWREDTAKISGPDPIAVGGRGEIWRVVA